MLQEYRKCELCPWLCGIDRTTEAMGRCSASYMAKVADAFLHFGEEACLVGKHGSGAVFFSHCNLQCVYCQTYELSWYGKGNNLTEKEFSSVIVGLIEQGCENLNFVTPTAYIPHIRWVVQELRKSYPVPPVVYNTGGYERVEVLRSLEGIVDIYLTDIKYWSFDVAQKLSSARDYPEVTLKAVKEMYRQVGDLEIGDNNVAKRGLLVRHLILPGFIEESLKIIEWIAKNLSARTYVNIMGHYYPCHLANSFPELGRHLRSNEYYEVLSKAYDVELTRIDKTHRHLYPLIWDDWGSEVNGVG